MVGWLMWELQIPENINIQTKTRKVLSKKRTCFLLEVRFLRFCYRYNQMKNLKSLWRSFQLKLRKKSKDKLNNSQISKFSSLQRRNQNPFQKSSTSKRKYRCLAILKTTPSINDFYNYYDFKYLWNNHNLGWICLFLASSFSISFKSDVPLLFPWLYFL